MSKEINNNQQRDICWWSFFKWGVAKANIMHTVQVTTPVELLHVTIF